ncbi:hypothetical protein CAEBREN_03863 [Caenorhabditis brenneri]|uniref:Uncharacterized protein n=1 Tax=Caenorhabditis brenneri TaxID=135651 RepID=G0ME90_CAEBE|nr:hypothetical protein CAEBREN_03863 [Caenorhabditis brenneri]
MCIAQKKAMKDTLVPHIRRFILVFSPRKKELKLGALVVYNQLNALFGKYVTIDMIIHERYDVIPTFVDNKRSKLSLNKTVNAQVLENYFMNFEEQEFAIINIKGLIGKLSSNSRFYNTQELHIQ